MIRGFVALGTWALSFFVFGVFLSGILDEHSNVRRHARRALTITDHTAITREGQSLRVTEADLRNLESGALSKDEPVQLPEGPEREVVELEIDRRFLNKLLYKRSVAERRLLLFVEPDSYIPARVTVGSERYRVWLRLKGDLSDHYRKDKWSFRIKVRRDKSIFGQRKISFQSPNTRKYLGEWLFHRAFRREGGIAPRYSFAEVLLNGTSRGIFALEEHFDKLLIENNRRRDGPILKIDENSMFRIGRGFFSFDYVNITAFQLDKLLEAEPLSREFNVGIGLLEGFRRGIYDAEQVFDVELLAKYAALADLMGTWHALRFHNLRFYYNGITGRLEPISFDGSIVGDIIQEVAYESMTGTYKEQFYRRLWLNETMVDRYMHHLEVFSQSEYLDKLWEEVGAEADRNEAVLRLEYPHYRFPRENLYRNQEVMRAFLQTRKPS